MLSLFQCRSYSLVQIKPVTPATGAIKMRAQERGGHFTPMTPAKRVEILKAEDVYRSDKSGMSVVWRQAYSNMLDNCGLFIQEFC